MKNMKKILSLLLSLVLMLGLCLSVNVSAEDSEDSTTTGYTVDSDTKTITVNAVDSNDYTKNTGIQDAINYINTQSDKTNWTITVNSGTYYRFTVLNGLDNLTVEAADGADVIISVLDNSASLVDTSKLTDKVTTNTGGTQTWRSNWYLETYGVEILTAYNVTLSGLTFNAKETNTTWYAAAVSTYSNKADNTLYATGLTVDNCTFNGNGSNIAFHDCTGSWTVSNCTFDNWEYAIRFDSDNHPVSNVTITDNTFTNCDRAIDSYFGGYISYSYEPGTFTISGNTIIGTEDLRCKIILDDNVPYNGNALGTVVFENNTLVNVGVILIDVISLDSEDVFKNNTFGDNSYIVVASEVDETIAFASYLYSPDEQKGYWELEDLYINGDETWTDEEIALIKASINEANENGLHYLYLDLKDDNNHYSYSNFIVTLTHLKDAIYWVGTSDYEQEPSVTKYVSGTDNESVTTDDDGNYNVYAGDTVDFSLSILGPDYLDIYFGVAPYTDASERGTHEITVHDVMDDVLTLDESSIEINIEGAIVSSDYYTVITDTDDNCDFHIVIDLVALYNAGLYVDSDEVITINYSAVVSSDAAIGTYENSTWLTYEYINKTEVSTVEINVVEVESESEEEPDDTPDTTGEPTNSGEEETAEEEANEEEVETETSDNTAIYMYATLGLLAAGGYLAITKKNLLRK